MRAGPAIGCYSGFAVRRGIQSYIAGGGGSSGTFVPFAPVPQQFTANGSGSVTARWLPPNRLANGADISGAPVTSYVIKYGTTDGGPYSTSITGISSAATSHTFTVPAGTTYFVVCARNGDNTANNESDNSFQVTLVVT